MSILKQIVKETQKLAYKILVDWVVCGQNNILYALISNSWTTLHNEILISFASFSDNLL